MHEAILQNRDSGNWGCFRPNIILEKELFSAFTTTGWIMFTVTKQRQKKCFGGKNSIYKISCIMCCKNIYISYFLMMFYCWFIFFFFFATAAITVCLLHQKSVFIFKFLTLRWQKYVLTLGYNICAYRLIFPLLLTVFIENENMHLSKGNSYISSVVFFLPERFLKNPESGNCMISDCNWSWMLANVTLYYFVVLMVSILMFNIKVKNILYIWDKVIEREEAPS